MADAVILLTWQVKIVLSACFLNLEFYKHCQKHHVVYIFVCFGFCLCCVKRKQSGIRITTFVSVFIQYMCLKVRCFGSEAVRRICVPCRVSMAQDRETCASWDSGSLILSGCGRPFECMCWQHSLTAFKLGQSDTSSFSKTQTAGFLYCFWK